MAFPATFNINYYKGDTYEFNIYPKDSTGAVFDLTGFAISGQETAEFFFSTARGSAGVSNRVECFARISDDKTRVECAIRPADSASMVPGTTYVYDVQITKPSSGGTKDYPTVITLLTGNITVTDQVTGAV
jgi:hypothetical protein